MRRPDVLELRKADLANRGLLRGAQPAPARGAKKSKSVGRPLWAEKGKRTMIERLLNFLIHGCSHAAGERAWPITEVGSHFTDPGRGRQVCPDCGKFRFYRIAGARSKWISAIEMRSVCQ